MLALHVRSYLFLGVLTLTSLHADLRSEKTQKDSPNIKDSSQIKSQKEAIQKSYGQLPLSFEVNAGQTKEAVRFLARGRNLQLFLEPNCVTIKLSGSGEIKAMSMSLIGASKDAKSEGLDRLPGVSNYIKGNDKSKWHTNIANYAKTRFNGIYPGIDIVYYGNNGKLEHDFIVSPNANPEKIRLSFGGTESVTIDAKGNLNLKAPGNPDVLLQITRPIAYQTVKGKRVDVACKYAIKESRRVGFTLAAYNRNIPLVIDPVIVYLFQFGGSDKDAGNGIAVDDTGAAYVTGFTASTDFPLVNASQGAIGSEESNDAFVSKLNPEGTALVYSTYLGGSENDVGNGIAVDANHNMYVVGTTSSSDFPTGGPTPLARGTPSKIFVTKFSPTGTLTNSFLFGGATDESANAAANIGAHIRLDSAVPPNVYIVGTTNAVDFPTTPGAIQTVLGGGQDAIVAKFNPTFSTLIYSSYLGGSSDDFGNDLQVDASNNVFIAGQTKSTNFPTTAGALRTTFGGVKDGFVTKINATATNLIYSTYLGGNANDFAVGIAIDPTGAAYITGETFSTDFPITPGAFQTSPHFAGDTGDAFVTKLNATGSAVVYSTFIGGSSDDAGFKIAADAGGAVYVAGYTASTDFPVTTSQTYFGGSADAFALKLNPLGSMLDYAFLEGTTRTDQGFDIAIDAQGAAYVAGINGSSSGPQTDLKPNPIQPQAQVLPDAFVMKIQGATAPANHALFYEVKSLTGPFGGGITLTLQDRFHTEFVRLREPTKIGNPVEKVFGDEDNIIVDSGLHYTSYTLCPNFFSQTLTADDQFGSLTIKLHKESTLLVPTSLTLPGLAPPEEVPTDTTHFRCYAATANSKQNPGIIRKGRFITPLNVQLKDEFVPNVFRSFDVIGPARYCVAVKKTHDGVLTDADITSVKNNYMCYDVVSSAKKPFIKGINTFDQFGANRFNTKCKPLELCVPSTITSP
jgi:hypothetical protein